MDIKETKDVYIAWSNTDLTEGRGFPIPHAVCDSETTAIRLGVGKDVQGCNCTVRRSIAVKIDGQWLAPTRIHTPTREDSKRDALVKKKKDVFKKIKDAGFTDEEINLIQED